MIGGAQSRKGAGMSMEQVLSKLTADPGFVDKLRANPEETLFEMGVEPSSELVEAVSGGGTSEELGARINKVMRGR
jgi:hypothetical protein